jgi:hypothetical protein
MSSPSFKSIITEASKVSEVIKPKETAETAETSESYSSLDFYPKNLNHAFMPKPDFEGYRQDVKKLYATDQIGPNLLDENLHQVPDNPNTFMSRIRERAIGKIAANDERR